MRAIPDCAVCWVDPATGKRGTNATTRLCAKCKLDPTNRGWSESPRDVRVSPYLTTRGAAEYLQYQSPSAIRTLKMKGLIKPAGRRGGTDLYRRDDLDRFVAGVFSARMPDGRSGTPG